MNIMGNFQRLESFEYIHPNYKKRDPRHKMKNFGNSVLKYGNPFLNQNHYVLMINDQRRYLEQQALMASYYF